MIACDGGCEDWYHGKCVNVRKEDEGLVDKYICPLCTEKGPNVTTWKPMCRREGCRNPARLRKGAESKYCSDECGVLFMKTQLSRLPGQKQQITPTRGTRGRADTASKRAATTVATAEIDLGPLGGVIRPHELKALALAAPDITTFRRFGSSASLSPTPEQNGVEDRVKTEDKADAITAIDDAASMRLEAISKRKDALRQRRLLLKDRERFITLAKEQATKLATGMKMKDMCGYDGRLAWDETTFKEWRNSADGVQAFNNSTLDAKSEQTPTANGDDSATAGLKPRPQPMRTMTTETAITNDGDLDLCTKRRCPRHAGWQKLVLHDIRFEETEVGNEMRRIDAEEKGIKENSSSAAKRKNMALSDGDLGSVEAVVQDAMEVDGRGEDWNAGMASMDMPQAIAASA
jgi:COMPASS component SPP1